MYNISRPIRILKPVWVLAHWPHINIKHNKVFLTMTVYKHHEEFDIYICCLLSAHRFRCYVCVLWNLNLSNYSPTSTNCRSNFCVKNESQQDLYKWGAMRRRWFWNKHKTSQYCTFTWRTAGFFFLILTNRLAGRTHVSLLILQRWCLFIYRYNC